ncbi:hypothetical protein F5051DRAFT_415908 [Lentinula edodes]|nr:hypothetical protein F5051DRAFT_415908 [Lentinula edodes]
MSNAGTLDPDDIIDIHLEPAAARTSSYFNAPDADVTIRSSDNVYFKLHKKYLECTTAAFPPAELVTDAKEIIHLTEGGDTLEILFQAIYPRPFPSLKDLKFDDIMLLAEAAEKYQVFSMIYACKIHLREVLYPSCSSLCYDGPSLQSKRKRLLAHAVKHDNLEMVRELQPLLINIPLSEVADILPYGSFKSWVGPSI